jgi:hypothetical protein
MPRLVFYPEKRLLFIQKRFFTLKNEKCPPLMGLRTNSCAESG